MIPLPIADGVLRVLDDLIPDADKRDAAKAQIRVALAAANSTWSPQGIVAFVAGLELVGYMAMVSWGGALFSTSVPLVWETLAVRLAIMGALFGLDAGQFLKLVDKLKPRRR